MAHAFRALAISGGILFGVVLVMILVSVVAVRRGAQAMATPTKAGSIPKH